MSPFEFVAAFFSVVIGLGISHMLSALSDLIEARDRVRTYWVQSLWAVTVLLLLIHGWWGMWDLRSAPHWTYVSFIITVAFLSALYLSSTLIFPRVNETGPVDLEFHFESIRPIFLTFIAADFALAVLVNYSLFKSPLRSQFVIGPALAVVFCLIGARTARRRYHWVLVVLVAGAVVSVMASDTTVLIP
jgi:hypothetical protein